MNKQILTILIVFLVVVGVGAFLFSGGGGDEETISLRAAAGEVVVHKSPTCGCCGVFASYLRGMGYDVRIEDTDNLTAVKNRLGVPREVESCHTTEIAGYIVEGHVPEVAIQKLLSEKPDIKGIGMGGMPQGSPGMPGAQLEDFVIYEITHEGTRGDVFVTL